MVATVLFFLVGCVFLFTGISKVMYARPFFIHVRQLGILPRSLNEIGASLFIQLECGVGAALVMFACPAELILALICLMVSLSALAIWAARSGRVEDCGCYGGWLTLSISQSVVLNVLYICMLAMGWFLMDQSPYIPMWKVFVIISVIALSNFLIRGSANSPLIDLSPLKPGRKWNPKWSDPLDYDNGVINKTAYIFITQHCYLCKKWDPYVLNLRKRPDLPFPVLIFPASDEELVKQLPDIPHETMKPGIFRFLVYQAPTAVIVKDGYIEDRWVVRFPDEFI